MVTYRHGSDVLSNAFKLSHFINHLHPTYSIMYTLLKTTISRFTALVSMLILMTGLQFQSHAQGCSAPSNLNSNVLASGTVQLTWAEIPGALTYTVQYRLGSSGAWLGGGVVATPSQVLANLLPETVYTWRVRANCSVFSSVATFNTGGAPGGNTACSSPSNLDALVTSPTTATLSWSLIEGAFYYTVQYRLNNLGAWKNAGSVSGTSISIANLMTSSAYGWRVKASCSVYSSVALFNTGILGGGGSASCSSPSNTETTNITLNSAVANWEAVAGAVSYTLQYRLELGSSYVTVGNFTTNSATITGLASNTQYVWRVKANCSPYGSDVQFATLGVPGGGGGVSSCSPPSNTNTVGVSSSTANVVWEPIAGALSYTLQYRLELGSTYLTVGNFSTASATISGLAANTQYAWRVKADCSAYGSDVQFTTLPLVAARGANFDEAVEVGVFPNPANDMVQLRAAVGAQVQIFSLNGQVIMNTNMTETMQEVNIAHLNNGIYFVRIREQAKTTKTVRLVVAH